MSRKKSNPFTKSFFTLFVAVTSPMLIVFVFIALIQTAALHIEGKKIKSLASVNAKLLSFYSHVLEYITHINPTPPFPFSSWKNRYDS